MANVSVPYGYPPKGHADAAKTSANFEAIVYYLNNLSNVHPGTQYQLAYYAATGSEVSPLTLITGSKVVVSDANGLPVAATTTAAEIEYVSGVTSAIQTQCDAKAVKALSNLASVSINTSLLSGADNRDSLGSSSFGWKDLFLTGSLKNGAATGITIDTTGRVLKPNQPCFLVTNGTGATDVTGDNTTYTVAWPTEVYDVGGNFASNTFTAPVTGKYQFSVKIQTENQLTSHIAGILTLVTSNRSYIFQDSDAVAHPEKSYTLSVLADMDATDTATITLRVAGGTKTVDILNDSSANYWSGFLVC